VPRLSDTDAPEAILKELIIGDAKTGKTHWAAQAAAAGFNVLYFGGDIELPTLKKLSPEAASRLYYMPVHDELIGGTVNPRMVTIISDFMTTGVYLWNDTKSKKFNAKLDGLTESGAAQDVIWEIKPARFGKDWVWVIDSWDTLAHSAMLDKANDLGVNLADIEKIERSIYAGTGNRLTHMLTVIQKVKCHVIVIGHGRQMEKSKNPEGTNKTVKEIKETERIVEWTKMIPISSSNPHGLQMGKFFSDIGWMEINAANKRKLNFKSLHDRVSGGHLNSIGDPDNTHSFANLVKFMGGTVPDGTQGTGDALVIHPAGTYTPSSPGVKTPLQAPESPKLGVSPNMKGLGGLLARQAAK
jgi:hypothetical protein